MIDLMIHCQFTIKITHKLQYLKKINFLSRVPFEVNVAIMPITGIIEFNKKKENGKK